MSRNLALLALALSGCFSMRYLAQAGVGQVRLLAAARPLSSVLNDSKTPPHIVHVLQWVPDMKQFGESRGLKATDNYARYADLHRDAAVWVVQACAPLQFQSKRWSFPIVGTVPYLGFFDRAKARAYGDELAKHEDLDVDVRGAAAYSTLGWFRDPVLSTMVGEGPGAMGELANTVLHESLHATVYFKGQSAFDESLASFVGDRLAREWLAKRFGAKSAAVTAYDADEQNFHERVMRLHRAYEDLDALYTSTASDDDKRAQKAVLLTALKQELGATRALNNATLAGYRTYDTGAPAFEKLFAACDSDMQRFVHAISSLHDADFPSPQMSDFSPLVEALAAKGCGQ